MAVLLDTATLARHDRAEAFHAAMMSASVPSRIEHEDPSGEVHARMHFWRLGTPDLFRNEGSGIRLVRTPKHVRIGGPERLALAVQVAGEGLFAQAGAEQHVRTGELMLVDLTAPYDYTWTGHGASQAFQIDYGDLGVGVETVRAAARRLPSSPLYDLVLHHLTVLPRAIDALQGTSAADTVGAATTLLVRALLMSAADERHEPPVATDVLLARIKWYARQHLADPSLTPDRIAACHHISLRYLYKLFTQEELSLEQWLIAERLAGAARQLASAPGKNQSIASIAAAWGFLDAGHFTRRFRAAYGMTPREWRQVH